MVMYVDVVIWCWSIFWVRAGINQSTLRKPAQPHKPKNILDPNLEFRTILNNLERLILI